MHDQKMREGQDRVPVTMPAGGFTEIVADVLHDRRRAALGLQRPAHLIIRIRLRLGQLIERLVHEEDGAVSSSAQVQIIEDGRRAGVASDKVKGVPGHAVLFNRHAGQQ